jgi:hypothetical protein
MTKGAYMSEVKFSWSNITCGEACWEAKEDVCKCSCNGKNHGIRKRGENPIRTKRVKGHLYYLQMVGNRIELMNIVNDLLPIITGNKNANAAWYDFNPSKAGSPMMLNYATSEQAKKWAELSQWKNLSEQDFYFESPAILWRREDISKDLFS